MDWTPFLIFWISYDMMRGVADSFRGVIHVKEPYELELYLFGWLFQGQVPAHYFQDLMAPLQASWVKKVLDFVTAQLYFFHLIGPFVTGWLIWGMADDRRMFYRYAYTMTIVNFMALLTFMIYPVAPPWYVWQYGYATPDPVNFHYETAGALINFDKLIGSNFFESLYNTFNANAFAAVPSLHAAYPLLSVLFLLIKFDKWPNSLKIFLVLFVLFTWFAAVYLNHHYIIDLLAGGIYVVIAFYICKWVLNPLIFEKFITPTVSEASHQNKS